MPLPIIIGVAALAAGAYGAKKGYDGYQKHSEADDIVNRSKRAYDQERSVFDAQDASTRGSLEDLGTLELNIGKSFNDFKTLADLLIAKLNANGLKKVDINIPQHKLQTIENYSYSAIGVLGSATGAGIAGVAAGFAVYGGVMALGAASTGTAISALSGVAATNATLAAIGGGSLAAGGMGIAGGTAILGAAVAAPVLLIAGWAYDSHGEESLKNARKASAEADAAITKLKKAQKFLESTEDSARRIKRAIMQIHSQFDRYFEDLKGINGFIEVLKGRDDAQAKILALGQDIMDTISNGYALAAILTDIIMTPIFRVKQVNGVVATDESGVPEMEKDADGSMILNTEGVDKALRKGSEESAKFMDISK